MKGICILALMFFISTVQSQDYGIYSYSKIDEITTNGFITLENEDWFGHSVEGIGDINGDGR